ncbi:MAG: phage replisome organizer N-terminal domain-containing protein [bacterium]|nr:phage replisome organizer N-terminal domain-containing protein [bacterium]
MADIKWIKITTDIFSDEKMLLIEGLPEHDSIIVIWFKLLAFAGRSNNNGVFMMNSKVPYTDEMLATVFRRPINTVRLALETFENFQMIERVNNVITIPNWDKHQNIDGMDKIREQNRIRVANYRERQKLALSDNCNVTCNATVTESNAIDKDKEEDKDKNKKESINYQQIADMYNDTCISFPRLKSLSDNRKKAIKARLHKYSIEDMQEVFTKAEASDFMKGSNNRNWTANFDWMMKDSNFVKILEGNYDNKGGSRNDVRGTAKPATSEWDMFGSAEYEGIEPVNLS